MTFSNKLYLVIFILLSNLTFSQDWIKTDITNSVSIKFPIKSEVTKTQNETVFSVNDGFAIYLVSVHKLSSQQSAGFSKENLQELYNGVLQGKISASNAELISKKEITVNETPILEAELFTTSNPQLPSQRFSRILYSNQNLITIGYWPISNLDNEQKLKFFNSLSITPNTIENTLQNNNTDNLSSAYESGYFIGKIISFIIFLGFIIGIVFLIRYFIKKNKKKKALNKEKPIVRITKIICEKCGNENSSNSKYCMKCGYELPKN